MLLWYQITNSQGLILVMLSMSMFSNRHEYMGKQLDLVLSWDLVHRKEMTRNNFYT